MFCINSNTAWAAVGKVQKTIPQRRKGVEKKKCMCSMPAGAGA